MAKQDEFDHARSESVTLAPEERQRIGDEIERMIALLDAADGDPDLCASEHDGLEPESDEEASLGWTTNINQTKALQTCHGWQAREDFELDTADHEPSLGALGGSHDADRFDQERWAWGRSDREIDLEDEHDGREPCVDGEPSLSLTNDIDQLRALRHASCGWNAVMTDAEGPEVDGEPSLASLHGGARPECFDQRHWARGNGRDLEEQCEDEGAQCDDEGAQPSHAPTLPPITADDLRYAEPVLMLATPLDHDGHRLPSQEVIFFEIPPRESVR